MQYVPIAFLGHPAVGDLSTQHCSHQLLIQGQEYWFRRDTTLVDDDT